MSGTTDVRCPDAGGTRFSPIRSSMSSVARYRRTWRADTRGVRAAATCSDSRVRFENRAPSTASRVRTATIRSLVSELNSRTPPTSRRPLRRTLRLRTHNRQRIVQRPDRRRAHLAATHECNAPRIATLRCYLTAHRATFTTLGGPGLPATPTPRRISGALHTARSTRRIDPDVVADERMAVRTVRLHDDVSNCSCSGFTFTGRFTLNTSIVE